MRYIITRPNGETYRIAGQTQGGDDLEAVKRRAQDLASERWNQCPLGIWDRNAYAPVCTVEPRDTALYCGPIPPPPRKRRRQPRTNAISIVAGLAILAIMTNAGNADTPHARTPARLQIVPASDSATFAACKNAGGFIEYDDHGLDDPRPPFPVACEWRPDAQS